MSSLEKILRLSGEQETGPEPGDELRQLACAVHSCLEEAVASGDPARMAELVLAAAAASDSLGDLLFTKSISEISLAAGEPGSALALAVLTTADRKKKSAHTIPGSTDFPIPDRGHLMAAIARYKQGALAGHSKAEVAAHIRSRAKALGIEVNLSHPALPVDALEEELAGSSVILSLAAAAAQGVPMNHPPMRGRHGHAHAVLMVHDHEHDHMGDSSHGNSPECRGAGAGKAWSHMGDNWAH